MSYVTIASRVTAGIAFLDEKVPGWREKIDMNRLELNNSNNCILGQLFDNGDANSWESGFDRGCEELSLQACYCCREEGTLYTATEFGFNIGPDDENHTYSAFDALQTEWERQLSPASA